MKNETADLYVVPQTEIAKKIDDMLEQDRTQLAKDISRYGFGITQMPCANQVYKEIMSSHQDVIFAAWYLLQKQAKTHYVKSLAKIASMGGNVDRVMGVAETYSKILKTDGEVVSSYVKKK